MNKPRFGYHIEISQYSNHIASNLLLSGDYSSMSDMIEAAIDVLYYGKDSEYFNDVDVEI